MVGMRMGQNHDIQTRNFFPPEKGADDPLSQIKLRIGRAPAIDQHFFTSGKFNERGIPMPDVQESYFKRGSQEIMDLR